MAARSLATAPTLCSLEGLPVFLSASVPEALRDTPRALDFQGFIAAFVRGLLAADGRLVFGGHPWVTPLVQRVASDFGTATVELFQLTRFEAEAPPEILSREFVLHWVKGNDLGAMREQMIDRSRAAVFVGGKTAEEQPIGDVPGIRDEYLHFLARHPRGPVYLLGLLDGEAARLIAECASKTERNHLSSSERELLHQTHDVDLAASLVLADLRRVVSRGLPPRS